MLPAVPEVGLQRRGGVVDHGAQAVDVGAGQRAADALLHDVEAVVRHAGRQLALLVRVHGNGLKTGVIVRNQKTSLGRRSHR